MRKKMMRLRQYGACIGCRALAPTVAGKHTGGKTNDGRRETACGPLEIGTYVF